MRIVGIIASLLAVIAVGGTAAAQTGGSIGQSLGVTSYPSKGQTPEVQEKDEGQCYTWAKQQTGIDPIAQSPAPPPSEALSARRRARQNEEQAQQQAKVTSEKKATFDKAFSACMTGRGYVTK